MQHRPMQVALFNSETQRNVTSWDAMCQQHQIHETSPSETVLHASTGSYAVKRPSNENKKEE